MIAPRTHASTHSFYYPELDSLRFFAFLLIFIHHTDISDYPLLSRIQSIGWIGVDIFFCLSAYLLTRLLGTEYRLNNRVHVGYFFMRRILRIWPLYFLFVAFVIFFQLFTDPLLLKANWDRAVGLVTFTDNIFAATSGYNPIAFTGHLWTISYEEQFYLCIPLAVPFLLKLSKTKRSFFLLTMVIIGWGIRFALISHEASEVTVYVLPLTHFESIMIGIALAWWNVPHRVSMLVCAGSLIVLLLLPSSSDNALRLMALYPVAALFAGGLVSNALCHKNLVKGRILNFAPFVYFGKISFGLYVFHIFAIRACSFLFGHRFPGIEAIAAFLLTLVLAHISYRLVESRFLRLKSNFTIIKNKPV